MTSAPSFQLCECSVGMEMIAGHPVVARCQSVATLLVRREHSLHYRGQTRVWRDAVEGFYCDEHDPPDVVTSGGEGQYRASRVVSRRRLRKPVVVR